MLEDSFTEVYTKFKLHFYQEIFSAFQDQEAGLSAMETFCMEVILALNEPTVNEFASFVRISSPNAAYKINSLLQKGYLEKRQSSSDRREYHLRPTEKYMRRFNVSSSYLQSVLDRVKRRCSPEDARQLDRMLRIVGQELMPEVELR